MKFWEIIKEIPSLEFDGDKTNRRLHSVEQYNWGAKEEPKYAKAEEEIDAIFFKGDGWEVYCWYDVSGWDYWMNNQEESNYIMTTIAFENEDVSPQEISKIKSAVDEALYTAENISFQYSYRPELEIIE